MKTIVIFSLALLSFTSCMVDIELDAPYINIRNIDEYETKEIIQEVWSGGVLVYEESIYHAWLDIDFQNTGGIRATDVWAEVVFFNNHREVQTINVYLPDIRSGSTITYELDTGFESIYDYTDYEVNVYWE